MLAAIRLPRYDRIILGDQALSSLSPQSIRTLLRGRGIAVFLCPHVCSGRRLLEWVRAGFEEILLPEELHSVFPLPGIPMPRPSVRLIDWLPQHAALNATQRNTFRVVPHLSRAFSVTEWARMAGISRQGLWRTCLTHLGMSPKDVLWSYVQTVVHIARQNGLTEDNTAALLGYSDATALSHAFHRRKVALPKRRSSAKATLKGAPRPGRRGNTVDV